MKKSLITVVALSAICLSSVFAAKEGEENEKQPPRRPLGDNLLSPRMVEALKLTDAQSAELKKLEEKFDVEREKLLAPHKAEIAQARADLKAAHEANDEAKVKDLRNKLRELTKPVRDLRQDLVKQFTAHLTPEQKAKLEEARERLRERLEKQSNDKSAPPAAE